MIDFSAEVGDLQRALASVQACVPTRTTMPVLSCVLLKASAGKVGVFASAIDMEAEDEVGADVGIDGMVAIHGGVLQGIISKLPKASTVTFSPDPDREQGFMRVSCGRTNFRLALFDTETMPAMPAIEGSSLSLKGSDLCWVIEAAAHCAATDESRWQMAGLNLRLDREASDLVATGFDGGARCSIVRVKLDTLPTGEIPSVTIPNFAIKAIAKMSGEAETVDLRIESSRVEVRAGKTILRTRLIGSEYPHDQIARIPEPTKLLFEVDADLLSDTAERVCAVFRRIASNAKILPSIGISPKDGELHMVAGGTRGVDEATDVVTVGSLGRFPELPIVTEQLVQALGVFKRCKVEIFQEQAGFPIAISSADKPGLRYYLAPMTRR